MILKSQNRIELVTRPEVSGHSRPDPGAADVASGGRDVGGRVLRKGGSHRSPDLGLVLFKDDLAGEGRLRFRRLPKHLDDNLEGAEALQPQRVRVADGRQVWSLTHFYSVSFL